SVSSNVIPRITTLIDLVGDAAKPLKVDSGGRLQLFGTISGTGGIQKTGSGMAVMDGSNSYGGRTTVSTGILLAENASALGATGTSNDTVVSAEAQLSANIVSGTATETLSIA